MIIELSKDKSLKAVLLKANIDNETMSLVKADANITDIKDSLIKNLSPNNIVNYRKYISKAEDEEEDDRSDEEIRDDVEDDLDETLSTTAVGGGGTGISQTKDLDTSDKDLDAYFEETESRRKIAEHKKLFREIKNVGNLLARTKVLAQNIVVKRSKGTLTGYKFLNFAAWIGKKKNSKDSNTLINLMTVLKKEPTFLNTRYQRILDADGKLEVIETKPGVKSKPINIQGMVDELLQLSKLMITIEGTNDKMSFYDVLINLHINEMEENPTVKQNRKLYARQLSRSKELAMASDKLPKDMLIDTKNTITDIQKEHTKLEDTMQTIQEQIEILESLLEGGTDGIIARKISRLTQGLQELYEDKGKVITEGSQEGEYYRDLGPDSKPKKGKEDKISELNELIQEISEGKVDVIEETTEEIQKDLEREQSKLEKVQESIERMVQFEEDLQDFIEIVDNFEKKGEPKVTIGSGSFPAGRPKDPDKLSEYEREEESRKDEMANKENWDRQVDKMIDLGSTLETIHNTLKKVSKLLNRLDEFEAEEFKEWVTGKAGTKPIIPEIDSEWLEAISNNGDVLDTYDNRDIVQMERHSHRLVKLYEKADKLKGALRSYLRN
jgi:prefoldin subunit 5